MNCEQCIHWKRRELYFVQHKNFGDWYDEKQPFGKVEDIRESNFGYCQNEKLIYTSAGGCVSDDDIAHHDQDDALLFSDNEAYGAYLLTGRNFGCVHFQEIEEKTNEEA